MKGGLLLDVGDHGEGALSPGFLGEVLPAGERREAQGFERCVLESVEVLPSPAGGRAWQAQGDQLGRPGGRFLSKTLELLVPQRRKRFRKRLAELGAG